MSKDETPPPDDPRGKTDGEIVIPVMDEDLVVGVKEVESGSVRVHKRVERSLRKIAGPLLRERVEIRRVPVNRVVEKAPAVRQEGDATIVPVVEERLTIAKKLVLVEEIHLIRRRTQERFVKEVPVARERVEIQRVRRRTAAKPDAPSD
jgi:uncharacterized protein (TIGR02271 family)